MSHIDTKTKGGGSEFDPVLDSQARAFLRAVLNYYPGDLYAKVSSAEQHLIEVLLSLTSELSNPFNQRGRDLFQVAHYSVNKLIPEMIQEINKRHEGGPLQDLTWN